MILLNWRGGWIWSSIQLVRKRSGRNRKSARGRLRRTTRFTSVDSWSEDTLRKTPWKILRRTTQKNRRKTKDITVPEGFSTQARILLRNLQEHTDKGRNWLSMTISLLIMLPKWNNLHSPPSIRTNNFLFKGIYPVIKISTIYLCMIFWVY